MGIAFGLKGILWFLCTDYVDRDTLAVLPKAEEIRRIHRELIPLRTEVMKMGAPTAVFGTSVTRDMRNQPVEGSPIAADCLPFPEDFWVKPAAGELVAGVFEDDQGRRALLVANDDACAAQEVELVLAEPAKVCLFDREAGEWRALEVEDRTVRFPLSPGGGELLRFE